MSKRRRDDCFFPPAKRCHVNVQRKRLRDEDEHTQRKRRRLEEEVLGEAAQVLNVEASVCDLRRENAYLRYMLGRVARIGFSLKAQRDAWKDECDMLRANQNMSTHPLITVQ